MVGDEIAIPDVLNGLRVDPVEPPNRVLAQLTPLALVSNGQLADERHGGRATWPQVAQLHRVLRRDAMCVTSVTQLCAVADYSR